MLIAYIATGVGFMLVPGTLVGVMNLLKISATHTAHAADAGWVQAHGHAQIFGWLGTFILGIGYYTIPRLRLSRYSATAAWTTYILWTAGVAMRWAVGSWPWNWRILFPLAGILEAAAVAIFCVSVYLARPRAEDRAWHASVKIIAAAGWAMLIAVTVGAIESILVARSGASPVFPFDFNQRYLVLITWGFIVPFIWGFSTRWLPPLLGLPKTRKGGFLPAAVLLFAGAAIALNGDLLLSAVILLVASAVFIASLRLWEPSEREPKLRGVHASTPAFLRIAYAWLVIAAGLGIVAAALPLPNGYAGASRHALTVGFFAVMVFSIGPRILPAFFNVRRLWSTRLMATVLLTINVGCLMRVSSQILAYEGISGIAWSLLPLSAIIEMIAVFLFALNMMMTLRTGSPLEAALQGAG
jgi:hypothetical protein